MTIESGCLPGVLLVRREYPQPRGRSPMSAERTAAFGAGAATNTTPVRGDPSTQTLIGGPAPGTLRSVIHLVVMNSQASESLLQRLRSAGASVRDLLPGNRFRLQAMVGAVSWLPSSLVRSNAVTDGGVLRITPANELISATTKQAVNLSRRRSIALKRARFSLSPMR